MPGRAKKVVLTEKYLRSLLRTEHPSVSDPKKQRNQLVYDALVPDLDVLWTPTALAWGMKKRWPGGSRHPTWRSLGVVYLPARGDGVGRGEAVAGGALTIAEARAKARRWLELLSRGIDPASEARRHRVEARKRPLFPAFRAAFLDQFRGKAKHGEATRILTKEFSCWDDHFADEIDAGDVAAAIQVIVSRGSKYQAHNAFSYIRGMYNWAMGQPRLNIKVSPCTGLSAKTLIGKKRPRTRVLQDWEIREVWTACEKENCVYPYGRIIQLLLLTALRENEVAQMRWEELDVDSALWTIPSARMKGEDDDPPPPHEVPLTAHMIEIIKSLPPNNGPFVFSRSGGQKPANYWSKAKRQIDKLSGVRDWIAHDLRRTVRTRISAIPAEEHVREALLAHGRRGIQAHYDQHRYRDEKRQLLQQWDDRLERILNPPRADARVVPLQRTAAL